VRAEQSACTSRRPPAPPVRQHRPVCPACAAPKPPGRPLPCAAPASVARAHRSSPEHRRPRVPESVAACPPAPCHQHVAVPPPLLTSVVKPFCPSRSDASKNRHNQELRVGEPILRPTPTFTAHLSAASLPGVYSTPMASMPSRPPSSILEGAFISFTPSSVTYGHHGHQWLLPISVHAVSSLPHSLLHAIKLSARAPQHALLHSLPLATLCCVGGLPEKFG
jgi:hypothetical protein